jgi:GMP synthase-like glutamine amidotransferase
VILLVDLEHHRLHQDPESADQELARQLRIKYRLEEISDQFCLIQRHERVTPPLLDVLKPAAMLVSGNFTDWHHYDPATLAGVRAIFRQGELPVLAFCGGAQLMVESFGGELGPMGPWQEGDTRKGANDERWPGMRQERGFMPIKLVGEHPLLTGVPERPVVLQAHYWEIKSLPEDFANYAISRLCPIQLVAHRDRPLFGCQFHPEQYDEAHPDGRLLLQNFFQIAAAFWRE